MTEEILNYLKRAITDERVLSEIHKNLVAGAVNSGEASSENELPEWFDKRFKESFVVLDENDYARALIRALWHAPKLASIDFGGGRLRDFAQQWTDTARGYLGEIAVQKFFAEQFRYNKMYIDTRRGSVEEFMPSDILVREEDGTVRKSKVKVSIKTGKFNARWIEIPESQFEQSDAFVLAKLGISRYHFSSYLKSLKTLEQLFELGKELKELDADQIEKLSKEIPNWMPIPAYVSGFIERRNLRLPIHSISFRAIRKRTKGVPLKESSISSIELDGGIGMFSRESLEAWNEIKSLDLSPAAPMTIAGIGKEVDGNFYASSGSLDFEKEKWNALLDKL